MAKANCKIPIGSTRLPALIFELGELRNIINEQAEKHNWTMVYALRYVHDKISSKVNKLENELRKAQKGIK